MKKVKLNCFEDKVVRYRSWAESETNPVEIETKRLWSNFEVQDFKNLVRNFASFWRKKILIGRKSRFSVFPINFVNFLSNFFSHGKSFFLSHRKQKKISFRVQSNENHFQRIFPLNWVCYFIALENLFYSCKDLTPAGRQTKDLSIRLYQT